MIAGRSMTIRFWRRGAVRLRCWVLSVLALLVLVVPGKAALAQNHEVIADSLVHLQVVGTMDNGLPLKALGTGFLVSDDGLVLTTHHLVDKFLTRCVIDGPSISPCVIDGSVKISAQIGDNGPPFDKINVVILDALPAKDLLLLKIKAGRNPYTPVKLGRSGGLALSTKVLTSGFPEDFRGIWPDDDRIRSKVGVVGYLWATNMEFTAGQSGSPVYLEDGTVIGVVKGSWKESATKSLFIPIDFADPLLITLRFDAVDRRLAALKTQCRVCFEVSGSQDLCAGTKASCSPWTSRGDSGNAKGWSDELQIVHDPSASFRQCSLKWKLECQ